MKKTLRAYQLLFYKIYLFRLFICVIVIIPAIFSYKVPSISGNILDSVLSIVSILFPLIAGFLTFGRDLIKDLNKNIEGIKEVTENKEGTPTTDKDKRKIKRLKNLATSFKSIVISTFYISFLLIIIILIAKFNSFDFQTNFYISEKMELFEFVKENWLNYIFKFLFFCTLLTLFMNLTYLVYFIVEVNKDENLQ